MRRSGQYVLHGHQGVDPEVIVEAEPTGYARSPYSKRRTYVDARNFVFPQMHTFDRRGELFKTGEPGFGQYKTANNEVLDKGRPAWSWTWYHSHDMQGRTMSRFSQVEEVAGGFSSSYDHQGEQYYNAFMTQAAMRRLGT